jgi:D-lactate dehydrogenase (cytochrome)
VSRFLVRARPPHGPRATARVTRDADLLASHLEDAAHFPGGHADGLVAPATEADVANAIAAARTVLPIGAQSSLTGGATPMGELLLSTARMSQVELVGPDRVRVQAGVPLAALDAALEQAGRWYPPAPTYTGAFVGGTIATNAAGAATFKYGATRDWVEALTVVLATGDVLDIERGAVRAHRDGYFDLQLHEGTVRVPVPSYRMPGVRKLSAGYFAAPGMDLVDLFVGSEGTLGVVTTATLRVLPRRPAICLAFVPFTDRTAALELVARLRTASEATWQSSDARGIDVSAIEYMDARCLSLLREEGADRELGVAIPVTACLALLVTLELPPGLPAERAFDEIGSAADADAPDTPLVRFSRLLAGAGVLDVAQLAVPGDRTRALQLLAVREAVPAAVNRRVGLAKLNIDPRIEKIAADVVVPFDRCAELMDVGDAEFGRRGLDGASWGHLSDGNLHPNVVPRSVADVEPGKAAVLEIGRAAVRLGGAPLAEHGVGRNLIKQQHLRELYGEQGIADMRAVKRALDPGWKLAPGVLFPRDPR